MALLLKKYWYWPVLLVAVLSCNSKLVKIMPVAEIEKKQVIKNAPDWVSSGSGYYGDGTERWIYGVGNSIVVGDMAMQKAVADDIARAEVEGLLIAFINVMEKKYTASVSTSVSGSQSEDVIGTEIPRQLQTLVKSSLQYTRTIKSWRNLSNNEIWTLASIDMKKIKSVAGEMQDMDVSLQRYFHAEADSIFDRLASKK